MSVAGNSIGVGTLADVHTRKATNCQKQLHFKQPFLSWLELATTTNRWGDEACQHVARAAA
jgi:hypothetical protein